MDGKRKAKVRGPPRLAFFRAHFCSIAHRYLLGLLVAFVAVQPCLWRYLDLDSGGLVPLGGVARGVGDSLESFKVRSGHPLLNETRLLPEANLEEVCSVWPGKGPEKPWGFQALVTVKVVPRTRPLPAGLQRKTVMCIVKTESTRHASHLRHVLDTWGHRCGSFLAVSNLTDESLHAVNISSSGSEWEILKSIWKYVLENFGTSYDFFHLASDNAYIVPENLEYALSLIGWNEKSIQEIDYPRNVPPDIKAYERIQSGPLYVGDAVIADPKTPYQTHCGPGIGYSLNREALQLLVANFRAHGTASLVQEKSSFSANEILATILRSHGVVCKVPMDDSFAHMFHEFGPDYVGRKGYKKEDRPVYYQHLLNLHRILKRDISNRSVGFHMVDGLKSIPSPASYLLKRFDAVVRNLCEQAWDPLPQSRDAKGKIFTPDPGHLRKNPPSFSYHVDGYAVESVCKPAFGEGPEKDVGYVALKKISTTPHADAHNKRVFCMIYTHSNRHHLIKAIAETWGRRCDGFLAASNLTDLSIGAINLPHEGPEEYGNMWAKIRTMWKFAYHNFLDDYDFFHIGGDDHYVIVENLRSLALRGSWRGRWNEDEPLYFGAPMVDNPYRFRRYCGGGAGYTLNRAALRLLVEDLLPTQACWPHWVAPDEDRIVASCFRSVGISCMDTNDNKNETRYHLEDVHFHARWKNTKNSHWHADDLNEIHGIASLGELGQVSTTSVSFHLKRLSGKGAKQLSRKVFYNDFGIRRYDAILYSRCPEAGDG